MLFSENNSAEESVLGDHSPSEIASDEFYPADGHNENEDESYISEVLRNHPAVIQGIIMCKNRFG